MILVYFKENEQEGTLSFKLSGHAGYSNPGTDIVCSAASILAYTLAQEISVVDNDKKMQEESEIFLHDGNAVIRCRPKREFYEDILRIYRFANTGYALLAKNFPKNVKIT